MTVLSQPGTEHRSETLRLISCTGPSHPDLRFGHASGPARWIVTDPCGEFHLMCDGWVFTPTAYVDCDAGESHRWEDLSIQPLA